MACSPSACEPSPTFSPSPADGQVDNQVDKAVDPITLFVGELHAYERLLRGIYAAGGRLATAAIDAQVSRNLSPTAGHQILRSITTANVSVTEAITRSAEAHRLLEVLGRQLNVDVTAYGDVHEKPDPERRTGFTGADGTYANAVG